MKEKENKKIISLIKNDNKKNNKTGSKNFKRITLKLQILEPQN